MYMDVYVDTKYMCMRHIECEYIASVSHMRTRIQVYEHVQAVK